MNSPFNLRQKRNDNEAAKLIAALPLNIQSVLSNLPSIARWTLAATVNELRSKGNRDIYLRGIAIGQATAAFERDEISQAQFEMLALYIGNLPN